MKITFKYQILISCSLTGKHWLLFIQKFSSILTANQQIMNEFLDFLTEFFCLKVLCMFWLKVAFAIDWIICKIFLLLSWTFLLLLNNMLILNIFLGFLCQPLHLKLKLRLLKSFSVFSTTLSFLIKICRMASDISRKRLICLFWVWNKICVSRYSLFFPKNHPLCKFRERFFG